MRMIGMGMRDMGMGVPMVVPMIMTVIGRMAMLVVMVMPVIVIM
jgi:hypothetical protein